MTLTAAMLAVGCADFEAVVDPAGGVPDVLVSTPSFAADVAPLLEKRCGLGGCHSIATHQANLALAPGVAYDALVGVRSTLRPAFQRVRPALPDSSWLVRMIGPDDAARDGFSRMPLAAPPLTPNQIATIVRWIEQGAGRN